MDPFTERRARGRETEDPVDPAVADLQGNVPPIEGMHVRGGAIEGWPI